MLAVMGLGYGFAAYGILDTAAFMPQVGPLASLR